MKKSNNNHKTYKSLSKAEAALLHAVGQHIVFSSFIAHRLTGWHRHAVRNALFSLRKKGIITLFRKNAYAVTGSIPEQLFAIATAITNPSYISFWTACSYYGFTEQQVSSIQVVSPKQYRPIKVAGHTIEATTLKPEKWFGYRQAGHAAMAEQEKALIDCLYKPEKCGGMEELRKCLRNAWAGLDQQKMEGYLHRFNVKSVIARCGYLLDELHLPCQFRVYLLKSIPATYTKLNPSKKSIPKYNKRWRIIVND